MKTESYLWIGGAALVAYLLYKRSKAAPPIAVAPSSMVSKPPIVLDIQPTPMFDSSGNPLRDAKGNIIYKIQ